MRKFKEVTLIIVVLLLMTTAAFAIQEIFHKSKTNQLVEPGQLHTGKNTWVVLDATTSSGTEPSDLAVGERTYTTIVAAIAAASSGDEEISIYGDSLAELQILESWNNARFRCIGVTNNQTVTYQIYLGTLGVGGTDCEVVKAGQLAFTIGQQVSSTSTYKLADTLTVTASDWAKSWTSSSPGGDKVAEAAIDMMGADIIVAVASTAGCDCKLLAKGY
jgi:hypothetical protein